MKIQITLGEILDHGNWDKYCKLTGLDEWCLNEGMADGNDLVILNVDEIFKYGLVGYVRKQTDQVY